jgi:hypothetical protein
MWLLDPLKKRSLPFQMNAVLLASAFSVGYKVSFPAAASGFAWLSIHSKGGG